MTGQTSSLQVETATSAQSSASWLELARHMVGCVDPDFAQRLDHLRVRGLAWLAARRARLMPTVRRFAEEPLGHHAAATVRDADEEDVHDAGSVCSTSACNSAGRVCSPRTNW